MYVVDFLLLREAFSRNVQTDFSVLLYLFILLTSR